MQGLVTNETPFQVLWKGTQRAPDEELNRLSQFTGSYASTTIDKAAEIQLVMKEKYLIIVLNLSHMARCPLGIPELDWIEIRYL